MTSADGSELFPGAFIEPFCFSDRETVAAHGKNIIIKYFYDGSCLAKNTKGSSFFFGKGSMLITTIPIKCIVLTDSHCQGITVGLNPKKIFESMPEYITDSIADFSEISKKFKESFIKLHPSPETNAIFLPLYSIPENMLDPYKRLKITELLLFLAGLKMPLENDEKKFPQEQLKTVAVIHDMLISEPQQHYTTEEISRKYFINTTTLKKIFKEIYGQPIASYMRSLRLKKAAELLCKTNSSIADIAASSGYKSQSCFTKSFKEFYGLSPTEYRKNK